MHGLEVGEVLESEVPTIAGRVGESESKGNGNGKWKSGFRYCTTVSNHHTMYIKTQQRTSN